MYKCRTYFLPVLRADDDLFSAGIASVISSKDRKLMMTCFLLE